MKPRVKAGNSKAAAAAKRDLFTKAFIANGRNATQAAITAGYSPKTAKAAGSRLLTYVDVRALVDSATEKLSAAAGLSVERTLQEVARLAYADPRKLYRADGTPIPIVDLDDDTAAIVAGVEVDTIKLADGELGRTTKVKTWDKNAALEKAMKHLGLYEKDNAQQQESLVLKIETAVPVKR